MKKGKVFIVGAGPGDPGLLTVRGLRLLERADAVVVDDLVNPKIIFQYVSCPVYYVGKRGPGSLQGAYITFEQKKINHLLVKLANQGKRVVRLKGGDPFIFGRVSEEIEFLKKNKISFQLVPGVSSAIAAPAYAGIPVTDRRFSSHVTFLTGQGARQKGSASLPFQVEDLPKNGTLVVLMGVHQWVKIKNQLLEKGWAPNTPVAAIESATLPEQKVIVTSLVDSSKIFSSNNIHSPCVFVIGQVAGLAKKYDWLKAEFPLLGCSVVVTRPLKQSQEVIGKLEEKGAHVLCCPTIKIDPILESPEIDRALTQLKNNKIDRIIFLSSNAVQIFSDILMKEKIVFSNVFTVCVGPATAKIAQNLGWNVKKVPSEFNAEKIIAEIGNIKNENILIPRVLSAPQEIWNPLKKKGARMIHVPIYENAPVGLSKEDKKKVLARVDAIFFTSASTADSFFKSFNDSEIMKIADHSKFISIGEKTSHAIRKYVRKNIIQSEVSTLDAMVESITESFNK
ncbi:MAG: uroporphyrinogen-III C-methyltransferase [Elusimicrobiota bacterium]